MANALLFTQQTVGLGARKTSMVFLAEALAAKGWETSVVTGQLSRLTRLKRDHRLTGIRPDQCNCWYDAGPMQGYVWVPLVHPFKAGSDFANALTAPLLPLYSAQLPKAIRDRVRHADLIIIESCVAAVLFQRVRKAAPQAHIVYSMSDRLDVVGMHPNVHRTLLRDGPDYDLIRVPAQALLDDIPGAKSAWIPHGIDSGVFDRASQSPFDGGVNAVLAGDMMLDQAGLGVLARAFPGIRFHYFGRTVLAAPALPPNLTQWGEVPFDQLAAFIRHADVGLALYLHKPGLEYIAQSSLKAIQYRYCGLAIVTPHFATSSSGAFFGYDPGDANSMMAAMRRALDHQRGTDTRVGILQWDAVVDQIIARLGLAEALS
ncbi:MAG: hypothetical protein RL367_455 [Pseudomonadota bacterium]